MENIADLSLSALRKTRLSTEIPTAFWVENNFVPLSAPYIKDYSILDNGTASSDNNDNRYTPRNQLTKVQYSDGTKIELSITGMLGQNSIPNKENATQVEIGKGVTTIARSAFSDCSGLTSVTIPNSVTSIGRIAFYNCSGLTSVTIPDSVTSIERQAFTNCHGLTSVTIPNGITSIGSGVFYNCSNLALIMIPDSMTSIGNDMFYNCSSLTSVTIGNSVTSIGNYAFYDCSALSSIMLHRTIAPTVQFNTFGSASTHYTGRATRSTGNNVLRIPQGSTGYDSSYWLDPLQDSTKCGFHIEYI